MLKLFLCSPLVLNITIRSNLPERGDQFALDGSSSPLPVTTAPLLFFSTEKFGQPYSCPRFFDASEDLLRRRQFFVSLFLDVRSDPLSIASPLVNTSMANSFAAAFRPSLPPLARFSLSLSSPLPLSPTPTRRQHAHTTPDTCVYITLCTGACWSTYLWLMYEIHALPARYMYTVYSPRMYAVVAKKVNDTRVLCPAREHTPEESFLSGVPD